MGLFLNEYKVQGTEPAADGSTTVTITFADEGIGTFASANEYDVDIIRGSVAVDTKGATTLVLLNTGAYTTTDGIYEVRIRPRNLPVKKTV